jgi:hypothetical protein
VEYLVAQIDVPAPAGCRSTHEMARKRTVETREDLTPREAQLHVASRHQLDAVVRDGSSGQRSEKSVIEM